MAETVTVLMNKTMQVSEDGVSSRRLEKDREYEIKAFIAESLVSDNSAFRVDELEIDKPDDLDKPAGDTPRKRR